jgi:hypothetical protein
MGRPFSLSGNILAVYMGLFSSCLSVRHAIKTLDSGSEWCGMILNGGKEG